MWASDIIPRTGLLGNERTTWRYKCWVRRDFNGLSLHCDSSMSFIVIILLPNCYMDRNDSTKELYLSVLSICAILALMTCPCRYNQVIHLVCKNPRWQNSKHFVVGRGMISARSFKTHLLWSISNDFGAMSAGNFSNTFRNLKCWEEKLRSLPFCKLFIPKCRTNWVPKY